MRESSRGISCRSQAAHEALLCGHVYHSECIQKYSVICGKPKAESCPLKCQVVMELLDAQPSRSPSPIGDHGEPADPPPEQSQPAAFEVALAEAVQQAIQDGRAASWD